LGGQERIQKRQSGGRCCGGGLSEKVDWRWALKKKKQGVIKDKTAKHREKLEKLKNERVDVSLGGKVGAQKAMGRRKVNNFVRRRKRAAASPLKSDVRKEERDPGFVMTSKKNWPKKGVSQGKGAAQDQKWKVGGRTKEGNKRGCGRK